MSGSPAIAAERGNPVVVAHQLVGHRARLDVARPAHQARHAESAFPVGVLLRAERRHGSVRPGVHVRAVVGGVDDDGVVGDAHVVERLEQRADGVVVLDHAVDVFAVAVFVAATVLGADMRAQVHARRVEPAKNGLPAACCRFMKSIAAAEVSSSIVSMRFLVSAPVSSIVCLPTLPKRGSTVGSSLSVALV